MIHHFNILFFLYKSKANKKGEMPIFCRVTLNGVRKQFATGHNIKEPSWNLKNQRCKGVSQEPAVINKNLETIEQKLNKAYGEIFSERETFFLDDIYNRFTGTDKEHQTVLQAFDYHNKKMKSLIGKDYVQATYDKFVVIENHVKKFIKHQYWRF